MSLSAEDLEKFRAYVSTTAGGYLRNIVREPLVTCTVCGTPAEGYTRCFACQEVAGTVGLADRVGSIAYAIAGTQSAHLMRGYKARPPSPPQQALVALLAAIAVGGHSTCAGRLSGLPISHWASVPSLPFDPGEHALHRLVKGFMECEEVTLTAAVKASTPRSVNAEHFVPSSALTSHSHVLVIDDTWTRGGHAQSAAVALHQAGAAQVSVLTVARWVEPNFANNKRFISDRLASDFDPSVCPWTAGSCP